MVAFGALGLAIVCIASLTSVESVRLPFRNLLTRLGHANAVVLTGAVGSRRHDEVGGIVDLTVYASDRLPAVLVQTAWVGSADGFSAAIGAVDVVAELDIGTTDGALFQGGVGQTSALEVSLSNVVEVLEA